MSASTSRTIARAVGLAAAVAALSALTGCSSVGGSAIRTGPLRLPPYVGAVNLYVARQPPAAAELGVVEVHAAQSEATIETLLPLFVKKVAALGGDGAVVDKVEARFDWVSHPYTETYTYSCGWRATCVGTRTYMVNDEVMSVSMQGRALRLGGHGAAAGTAP